VEEEEAERRKESRSLRGAEQAEAGSRVTSDHDAAKRRWVAPAVLPALE